MLRMLVLAGASVATLVCVASALLTWLARHRRDTVIDGLIKPSRDCEFGKHDEDLQLRTSMRRKAAEAIRSRARRIESGVAAEGPAIVSLKERRR
jgi:hypothetical protein